MTLYKVFPSIFAHPLYGLLAQKWGFSVYEGWLIVWIGLPWVLRSMDQLMSVHQKQTVHVLLVNSSTLRTSCSCAFDELQHNLSAPLKWFMKARELFMYFSYGRLQKKLADVPCVFTTGSWSMFHVMTGSWSMFHDVSVHDRLMKDIFMRVLYKQRLIVEDFTMFMNAYNHTLMEHFMNSTTFTKFKS